MHICTDALRKDLTDDLKIQERILTSDMSLESANRLWMANSFWKKFQDEVGVEANAECLKLFKQSNERCRAFYFCPQSLQDELVIGEVKKLWDDLVFSGPETNVSMCTILDNINVGPGASLGVESHNFYTKLFDSDLTGTSERLYRFYRYAIAANPTWLSAEKARDLRYGHAIVSGSRLSFVPKTSEVSRSICTEPVVNLVIQKGIGALLEQWLKRKFRIDLSRQPNLNREMARIGSIDGSFGTIDLSSASDSVSLEMLREILPPELLGWLELARSPAVVYPDGSSEELYMVSSMGNAFTFPLETLIFSTIVVACYRVLGIAPKYRHDGPENFSVFGDDIIVRKDSYEFVSRALRLFGFVVNDQKSFNAGSFRESCGGDFFRGTDIRGVYCKSLSTGADVYSLINRLTRWSARTGIMLPKTFSHLMRHAGNLRIPHHDGDAEGIKVPYAPAGLRVDRDTQALVYKALVSPLTSVRMPVDDESRLYYPRKAKWRSTISYNAEGLIVAVVGGFIRNGRVSIRNTGRPKIRRRTTSRWEAWRESFNMRKRIDWLLQTPPTDGFVGGTVEQVARADDWVVVCELYGILS